MIDHLSNYPIDKQDILKIEIQDDFKHSTENYTFLLTIFIQNSQSVIILQQFYKIKDLNLNFKHNLFSILVSIL